MEKTINIVEWQDKIAKNNKPYCRYKLSDGKWISCFNEKANIELKTRLQRNIVVNVFTSQKEGFEPLETIAAYVKDLDEAEIIDMTKIEGKAASFVPKLKEDSLMDLREKRMWAEMAKEIYLAMVMNGGEEGNLERAIAATKKLREEFK